MIPDPVFAVVGVLLATAYLTLGGVMLVAARHRIRRWPVTAYIALAGPYIAVGFLLALRAAWRIGDPPGAVIDPNGVGTIIMATVALALTCALIRRLWTGTLLTDDDRREGAT